MTPRTAVVGVLFVIRRDGVPFTVKQEATLETFADQAVIAIENARQFNELQERNREVTEALEQQTAMAEVLSIIAASATDAHPVLQAVTERARPRPSTRAAACNTCGGRVATADGTRRSAPTLMVLEISITRPLGMESAKAPTKGASTT